MKTSVLRVTVITGMLLLIFINPALFAQERRIALVIGNGAYKSAPLRNPVNDAGDIADALGKLGFSVMLKINADQRTMEESIRDFGRQLQSGGAGLFFFAGHGLQVKGRNYLIPVGAKIETESDVKYESVDAGRVLGKMEDAGNKLNIIILDACRNNPFARSFRSTDRGLAKMDAPTGSILAYATAPGSVASDGPGRNGLYTSALLKHMIKPGLSIEKMFKQMRIEVVGASGKKQVPWESSSLTGDFYFNTDRGIAVVKHKKIAAEAEKLSPIIPKSQQTTMEMELAFWQSIQNSDNPALFESYLKKFPNGTFADIAKAKIDALERKKLEEKRKSLKAEKKRIAIEEEQKRLDAENKKILKKETPKITAIVPSAIKSKTVSTLTTKQTSEPKVTKPQTTPSFTYDNKNHVLKWHDYLEPLKLKNKIIKQGVPLKVWVNLPENIIEELEYIPLKIKTDIPEIFEYWVPYFLINGNIWDRYSLAKSLNATKDIVNIPSNRLIAGKNIFKFFLDLELKTASAPFQYELIELSFVLR